LREGQFAKSGILYGAPLNNAIDFSKVQAYNCKQSNAEVAALLNIDVTQPPPPPLLESDADEQLLLHIPFREFLRIRGISIIGAGGPESPSQVKLYAGRTDVTGFDSIARAQPTDTILLADTAADDDIVYTVNAVRFLNCGSVTIFFDRNFGGVDETKVKRIVFYGESTKQPTAPAIATNVVYELRGLPSDHPMPEDELRRANKFIS
jgi:hypothetical protein